MVSEMILYHPAKDINHSIYRMISILISVDDILSIDKLRLLDFYYTFPNLLKEIKPWPADIKASKKLISKIPEPYEKISNSSRLFYEISNIQKSSLATLHSKGILDDEKYRDGKLLLNVDELPKKLLQAIKDDEFLKSDVFKVISFDLLRTQWEGKKGLKSRTGLLEYKYDE